MVVEIRERAEPATVKRCDSSGTAERFSSTVFIPIHRSLNTTGPKRAMRITFSTDKL
jgi:hypothetical protein